jgi:hypothetical protein
MLPPTQLLDALKRAVVELFSYVPGTVFLLIGSLIMFASYVRQISNYRNRYRQGRRWSSPAPFIGPVLVILGNFALPIEFSKWILLVIVFDPDTVVTILSIPYLFKALRKQ